MRKKILLISFMVVMLALIFALSISATTYNYYENKVAEDNKLYTLEASFSTKNTRFELISSITTEKGFAKTDADGNALTWYVISDDLDSDADGVRNIVVKSTPTIGGDVGTADENGNYHYYTDTDGVSFSKKVVSVNFFGENVTTLPEQAYMATYNLHKPGQLYQYCQIADGSYLLALYLPKTLTEIPKQLCFRAPIIVLEFEDNRVKYENFGEGVVGFDPNWKDEIAYAFSFCANLKSLTVPEGIKTIQARTFRECISLSYVKFPSTMTRLDDNVFFHAIGLETVIFGENMTFIGYLNSDGKKVYSDWGLSNTFKMKYMYVPDTISEKGSTFDSYRGTGNNLAGVEKNVVFFFAGSEAKAIEIQNYTFGEFKKAIANKSISYDEYLSDTTKYNNFKGHILVHSVPKCVAFHDGQHTMEPVNTYKDTVSSFKVGDYCKYCDYTENGVEYAPILEFLGYSAKIDGDRITLGYKVNKDSYALYPDLSYGIVLAIPGETDDTSKYEPVNADLTLNGDKAISVEVDSEFVEFNFIVDGFSSSSDYYDMPIVMCVYVKNGENIDYLCHNESNDIVQVSYATPLTFKYISESFQ